MATAAEYRQWAEECFKWAREAKDEGVRGQYFKMGELWLEYASRTELPAGSMNIPSEPKAANK